MNIGSSLLPLDNLLSSRTSRLESPSKLSSGLAIQSEAMSKALTNISLEDRPAATSLQGNDNELALFEGKKLSLGFVASDTTRLMQAILERLPLDQAQNLIDTELIANEDFIELASELSDQDLSRFSKVALSLQTQATIDLDTSGRESASNLVKRLLSLDSAVRSNILELASELSNKVPLRDSDETYDAKGLLSAGSPAANDLHNFVNTINSIGGPSQTADTEMMLEKLASYTQDQQSDLLQVLGGDVLMGMRLMDSLVEYGEDTQDAVFSYLSELSKTTSLMVETTESPAKLPEGTWAGSVLGYDDTAQSVVLGMLDKVIALTENYSFSDKQLEEMASDLKGLGSTHQRAYIEITHTGLSTIFGGPNEFPQDLSEDTAPLDAIDNLRSDYNARELVARSGMGERHIASNGKAYYEIKDINSSQQDQRQTIELLTKDVWLNQGDADRAGRLAAKFNQLDADQRDSLIDDLNILGKGSEALIERSHSLLTEDYQDLLNRIDPISKSENIDDLLGLEAQLPSTLSDRFWQAADISGEGIDAFVQSLAEIDVRGQQLLIEYIATLADLIDQEGLERDAATLMATETIEFTFE